MDDDKKKITASSSSAVTAFMIISIMIVAYISCFVFEEKQLYALPASSEKDIFSPLSVSRSRSYMEKLTEMSPRIAGTVQNDVIAKDYIIKAVKDIEKKVSLLKVFEFEFDIQHPCGSYHLDFLNRFTNIYCNITNVIVRLTPKKLITSRDDLPSLLINAHFDSYVMSSGASDDIAGVAIMLEVMQLLSSDLDSANDYKNSIIFLFNGAEESNLQGAHGFITQHRWAKNVRTLINLEAMGSSGKELIFQCNSPWFISLYGRSVPFPYSSSIGHEIFQLLLHRVAATDWRMFIEFGPQGIVGTDSAYVANGYTYHTSFDTADSVSDETLFNTGSNLYYFSRAISFAPELSLPFDEWVRLNNFQLQNDGKTISNRFDSDFIFTDFLGLTHITYSGMTIYLLHFTIGISALLVCWIKLPNIQILWILFTGSCKNMLKDALFCTLVGFLYSKIAPMRWYSNGFNYGILIFLPVIATSEVLFNSTRYHEIKLFPIKVCREIEGLIFWAVLLVLFTFASHKGTYMYMWWVLFGSLNVGFRQWIAPAIWKNSTKSQTAAAQSICIELVSFSLIFIPVLTWMRFTRITMDMFIPLLGKTGSVLNGDMTLGFLFGIFFGAFFRIPLINPSLFTGFQDFVTENITLFAKYARIFSIFVLVGILVFSSIFTYSYSPERPKRLWIHHVDRDLTGLNEGNDSGIWVVGFDGLGMLPLEQNSDGSRLNGIYKTSSFRGTWLQSRLKGSAAISGGKVGYEDHKLGYNCAIMDGECYMYWPYYFPVADALRDAHYLPSKAPVFTSNVGDESDKIFSLLVLKSSTELANLKEMRKVELLMTGPTHQTLVIRDHNSGNRIKRLGYTQSTFNDSMFASRSIYLHSPPAARLDGTHYFQIGFGLCEGSCLFRLILEIEGSEGVEVSGYGHYVLMRNTEELNAFKMELPEWSVGAEWTSFVSRIRTIVV